MISRNVEIKCCRCGRFIKMRRVGDMIKPEDIQVMEYSYCRPCTILKVVEKVIKK